MMVLVIMQVVHESSNAADCVYLAANKWKDGNNNVNVPGQKQRERVEERKENDNIGTAVLDFT